jgi:hypothetical protein
MKMKKLTKILVVSGVLLSSNVFSATTYEYPDSLVATTYKPTIKEINLCSDWACGTPFNMFTGSQLINVTSSGVDSGGSFSSLKIPDSGTYGYLQLKLSKTFVLNGYGQLPVGADNAGKWCATNNTGLSATSALAAIAASTENSELNTDFFKAAADPKGNGVDALGKIKYGTRADQTSIGGGYSDRVDGTNTSDINAYTFVLRTDSLADTDFYMTTVLQGNYDFGSSTPPSAVNFGISIDKMIKFKTSDCSSKGAEPVFDFVIQ